MSQSPGSAILIVLVLALVVGGMFLNMWAIHRIEQKIGGVETDPPAAAGTGDAAATEGATVRRFPDGTIEAHGVLVLPNGVVIVPDGSRAKVYTRDGRVITAGDPADTDGDGTGGNVSD